MRTQSMKCVSVVLLFLAAVSVASADYQPLAVAGSQADTPPCLRLTGDLVLAGVAAGGMWLPWCSNVDFRLPGLYFGTRYLNVGVGLEKPYGPGVSVSTTLLNHDAPLSGGSVLPVSVRLSWDLSSEPRWHHSSIYAFATLHHTSYQDGQIRNGIPVFPQTELGIGVAYTGYVMTPRAEFRVLHGEVQTAGPMLVLAFSLDLGGTYAFGRSPADEY